MRELAAMLDLLTQGTWRTDVLGFAACAVIARATFASGWARCAVIDRAYSGPVHHPCNSQFGW